MTDYEVGSIDCELSKGFDLPRPEPRRNGFSKAEDYLKSREIQDYLKRKETQHTGNPLLFADSATPVYHEIIRFLPAQARRLLSHILGRYGAPITASQLAKQARLPVNQCTSQFTRLKRADFLKASDDEYFVDDALFLNINAIRWDLPKFQRWRQQHPEYGVEVLVDKFIEEMRGQADKK